MHLRSIAVLTLLAAVACSGSQESPSAQLPRGPYTQTDLVVGTGTLAATGNRVTVAYAGWLYDPAGPDGKGRQFDANATGFTFQVGVGAVIRGWDQGVPGMRVGGQRRLVIPPELAYGTSGNGPIPPNATLVFDIALLSVQ
jgi:FKBP-type peptidyl-prolyl cis-trans isomerase FkpA